MDKNKLNKLTEEAKRIFLVEQKVNCRKVLDLLLDYRIDSNQNKLVEIKRFFHTVKGSALMYNYKEISKLAEFYEEFLETIRSNIDINHKLFSTILEGISKIQFELNSLSFSITSKEESIEIKPTEFTDSENDLIEYEYFYANKKEKILIIDDDTSILSIISKLLLDENYEVITFSDPIDFIQKIHNISFSIAILDLNLPNMLGIEVFQEIKNKKGHIPTIFISTENSIEIKSKIFQTGASDYISKPFEFEEFLLRINRVANELKFEKSKFYFDNITSATNKKIFDNNFIIAKKRYSLLGEEFSIAFVDLDNLSEVNDKHGYNIGNELLKSFYEILRKMLHTEDQIYRGEKEDFIVLLPNCSTIKAFKIFNNILQEIIKMPITGSVLNDYKISFCTGISGANKGDFDEERVLENTYKALKEGKTNGKSKITLYRGKLSDTINIKTEEVVTQIKKIKILIIDDSTSMGFYIKNGLELLNYEVAHVTNGEKGLIKYKTFKPDFIIIDINLPSINGFEVVNNLMITNKEIRHRIAIITADGNITNINKCRDCGLKNFLIKPFTIEQLHERLLKMDSMNVHT